MSKASSVPFAIESTIFALDPGRSRVSFPGKFINEVWFTPNKSLVFVKSPITTLVPFWILMILTISDTFCK